MCCRLRSCCAHGYHDQMLRPDFEELANSFIDEATFAAIDCQRLPETAKEAGITQHPTFQVLHEVRGCVLLHSQLYRFDDRRNYSDTSNDSAKCWLQSRIQVIHFHSSDPCMTWNRVLRLASRCLAWQTYRLSSRKRSSATQLLT